MASNRTQVRTKLLHSVALILGATAVMVVGGLFAFFVIWVVVLGLFLYSRLSETAVLFSDWSWLQMLMTIGLGLGVPYVILLATAGF